jgi:hypothetical protein
MLRVLDGLAAELIALARVGMFARRTSTFAPRSTLTVPSVRRVVLRIVCWRPLSGPRESSGRRVQRAGLPRVRFDQGCRWWFGRPPLSGHGESGGPCLTNDPGRLL